MLRIGQLPAAKYNKNYATAMGINLNKTDVEIVAAPLESRTHDKGAFYHFYDVRNKRREEVKPNPDFYTILISQAKQFIKIWDPYFHETEDCEVFKAVKASNIIIKVVASLDHKNRFQDRQSVTDYCKNIESNLPAAVKSATITVLAHDRNDWHDRFLIIDDRCFLVGASVNNQLKNNLSHGIYEVTNQDDKKLIKDRFEIYFSNTRGSYKETKRRTEAQQ